ncbi:rubrerythrin-like domain-containing protein [Halonotius terrestris]|uniref:Rubrerythrin-like domain-containing protein n=1 Tax=Halonotius terrestris TaxID=2487750 RepID=A0A8J8TDA4_9EURY|nr:rubrerythrin-like domain-containing protein [Halonotius terrestris]TQQ83321.1 rubrerythrin-like domain-containing protein [Halonotius terrestris]
MPQNAASIDPYTTEEACFECLECGARARSEERIHECSACGGEVKNIAIPRE